MIGNGLSNSNERGICTQTCRRARPTLPTEVFLSFEGPVVSHAFSAIYWRPPSRLIYTPPPARQRHPSLKLSLTPQCPKLCQCLVPNTIVCPIQSALLYACSRFIGVSLSFITISFMLGVSCSYRYGPPMWC